MNLCRALDADDLLKSEILSRLMAAPVPAGSKPFTQQEHLTNLAGVLYRSVFKMCLSHLRPNCCYPRDVLRHKAAVDVEKKKAVSQEKKSASALRAQVTHFVSDAAGLTLQMSRKDTIKSSGACVCACALKPRRRALGRFMRKCCRWSSALSVCRVRCPTCPFLCCC
jgi:hypothetical protein